MKFITVFNCYLILSQSESFLGSVVWEFLGHLLGAKIQPSNWPMASKSAGPSREGETEPVAEQPASNTIINNITVNCFIAITYLFF